MSKVPKRVSNFFLYKKIYNDVKFRNKNAGFIIVGQTGSGKSWLALRLAESLDPGFNIKERVVYTADEFLSLVASGNLKRNDVIIFDELSHGEGAEARSAMSRTNRILGSIVSTYRALGLIVIFVLPSMNQLDKNLRMISITGIFRTLRIDYKKKQTLAAFYWNDLNPMQGTSYLKKPVIRKPNGQLVKVKSFRFDAPSVDLVKEYEKKKMKFVLYNAKKSALENLPKQSKEDSLSDEDIVNEIKKNPADFVIGDKIKMTTITSRYKIGINRASQIAKSVKYELFPHT